MSLAKLTPKNGTVSELASDVKRVQDNVATEFNNQDAKLRVVREAIEAFASELTQLNKEVRAALDA